MSEFLIIMLIALAVIAIIIVIICVAIALSKKKGKRIKIDDAFINKLLNILGAKDNINTVAIDNGRLKFNVKDLEAVNLDSLKEISTAGVFVTGNNIKVLFKLDSLDIKKSLDKIL